MSEVTRQVTTTQMHLLRLCNHKLANTKVHENKCAEKGLMRFIKADAVTVGGML